MAGRARRELSYTLPNPSTPTISFQGSGFVSFQDDSFRFKRAFRSKAAVYITLDSELPKLAVNGVLDFSAAVPHGKGSSQDLLHHFPLHVGQSEVASCVPVGQLLVIQPEQMENGRVQIVEMHPPFHGVVAVVIGGPVAECQASPPPCRPAG